MHNYDLQDFIRYYRGAHILHPRNDTVVKVAGTDSTAPNTVTFSDKTTATLQELDWKHVQTPQLGYRTLLDGKALYFVERRAGRRTEKGVTPAAITVEIPGIVKQVAKHLGISEDLEKHAQLEDKLATVLFHPVFTRLADAITLLTTKKHTLGFALSHDWAITLGLFDNARLLLHFKNQRVAQSVDGKKWKFLDEDAEYVFKRSELA